MMGRNNHPNRSRKARFIIVRIGPAWWVARKQFPRDPDIQEPATFEATHVFPDGAENREQSYALALECWRILVRIQR